MTAARSDTLTGRPIGTPVDALDDKKNAWKKGEGREIEEDASFDFGKNGVFF